MMKATILVLSLIFGIVSTPFYESGPVESIMSAIGEGNCDVLNDYFADRVEITLDEDYNVYTKSEANTFCQDFFSINKPVIFKIVHEGKSKGKDSIYSVGKLKTKNNSFRVYVFMSTAAETYMVEEMKFERLN